MKAHACWCRARGVVEDCFDGSCEGGESSRVGRSERSAGRWYRDLHLGTLVGGACASGMRASERGDDSAEVAGARIVEVRGRACSLED